MWWTEEEYLLPLATFRAGNGVIKEREREREREREMEQDQYNERIECKWVREKYIFRLVLYVQFII